MELAREREGRSRMKPLGMLAVGVALSAALALGSTPLAAQDATELTAILSQQGGSGATGSATIIAKIGGTKVAVTMAGLPEGPHANHLHHGTCDVQGAIHVTLGELIADADGNATQGTIDNEHILSQLETGHYLAVHEGGNDTIGAVISCGKVEIAVDEAPEAGSAQEDIQGEEMVGIRGPVTGTSNLLNQGRSGISIVVLLAGGLATFGLATFSVGLAARRINR